MGIHWNYRTNLCHLCSYLEDTCFADINIAQNKLTTKAITCGFHSFQDDANVEALDKLKNNQPDVGDKLEDSLKKLHDSRSEEKPAKVNQA